MMLGVMRYKSTGDMLASSGCEFFHGKKSKSSRRAVRAADSEQGGFNCVIVDDDDDYHHNDDYIEDNDDMELARQRPLLAARERNANRGTAQKQWRSCKFLGSDRYGYRDAADGDFDELEKERQLSRLSQSRQIEQLDKFASKQRKQRQREQSKSTGDFLAAIVLSQSLSEKKRWPHDRKTNKQEQATTKVKLYSDDDDDQDEEEEGEDEDRAQDGERSNISEADYCGVDDRTSYDGRLVDWSEVPLETIANERLDALTTRTTELNGRRRSEKKLAGAKAGASKSERERTSGTRKKRKVKQRCRPKASGLSLSSPSLVQEKRAQVEQQGRGQVAAGQMAIAMSEDGGGRAELGLLQTLQQQRKMQVRGCEANGAKARTETKGGQEQEHEQERERNDCNGDDTALPRHQEQQQQAFPSAVTATIGAETSETKAKASKEHCIVNVGQIMCQHQQRLQFELELQKQRQTATGNSSSHSGQFNPVRFALAGQNYRDSSYDDHHRGQLNGATIGSSSGGGGGCCDDNALELPATTDKGVGGNFSQFYDGQPVTAVAGSERVPIASNFSSQSKRLPSLQDSQQSFGFHYAGQQQLKQQSPSFTTNTSCAGSENKNHLMLDKLDAGSRQRQRPLLVCQSQESAKSTPTTVASSSITNKLMVDLSSAANKLMGTCCDTWLGQTLHSGCYKVNQQQQEHLLAAPPVSGLRTHCCAQDIGLANNGGCGGRVATVGYQQSDQQQQVQLSRAKIARYSRPGRSPISLQRQTNARLARHRLKIQQQRQQQLTQLALRNRGQLNNSNSGQQQYQRQVFTSTNSTPVVIAIDTNESQQEDQEELGNRLTANLCEDHPSDRRQSGHNSLYLINGLLDRLPFSRLSGRQQQQQAAVSSQQQQVDRLASLENSELEQQQRNRQHQVIVPTTRRSIEICDSQLAGSSRQIGQEQQQSLLGASQQHRASSRYSSGGNVIVYKSINMLQNSSISGSRSAGSGRRGTKTNESDYNDDAIESDSQTICSSSSTLSSSRPFCKICHLGSGKIGDKLISPCRCSGTMQYIHCGCLLKWLEISNRSNEKPISCELCAYEYTWHKKFNYKQMRLPRCSLKDVFLHMIFVAAIGAMLYSALLPMINGKSSSAPIIAASLSQENAQSGQQVLITSHGNRMSVVGTGSGDIIPSAHLRSFRHYNGQSNHLSGTGTIATTSRLAQNEKFMLLCAASFFISFFVAIYVQTKARDTLYGLIVKFLNMNKTYYITEYDHGQQQQQQLSSSHNATGNNINASGADSNNNNGNNINNTNSYSNNNNGTGSSSGGSADANSVDVNGKRQQNQYTTNSSAVEDSRLDRKSLQKS